MKNIIQSKTNQTNKTKQNKTKQNKTKQNKTKQNKTNNENQDVICTTNATITTDFNAEWVLYKKSIVC